MLAVQPDQMSTIPSQIENHDVAAARKASHVVRQATPSGWLRREPMTAAHDNLCRSLCVALSLLVLRQPSDSPSRGLTPVPEAGLVYPRRASVAPSEKYARIPARIDSATSCWNFAVLSLRSSSTLLIKAVSTRIEGISGAFSTAKPACST